MKYRYRAISDRKEEKRGILEAENQMQAVAMIRENGDLILDLLQFQDQIPVFPDAGCCDDPGKRGSDPGTGAGT